jgi:Mn2+/Fe2+ NRAMP family transporter
MRDSVSSYEGKQKVSNTSVSQPEEASSHISKAPQGWKRLIWLGPSFLWMLSAAGSGEVLFTPRIAALYGYTLLWALLAAVVLKWFINREVGRYTVCTGKTVLFGFHTLPGPKNWAIWIILIPQLVVAASTIAGMSGAAADALQLIFGGSITVITVAIISVTGVIVLLGKYSIVERIASICGILLSLSVMVAAISIMPDGKKIIEGLIPQLPNEVKHEELLPWLGFMLAGAAGLMWYSNWVQARGYGAANDQADGFNLAKASVEDTHTLKKWISQMTISNTLAVVGALLIAIAFLILGTELLLPKGLVPSEDQMSEVLGELLGNIWGRIGFWFMIGAIFITFWTTALTNQDGWGRMFASGTKILCDQFNIQTTWNNENALRKIYIIVLLIISPVILYIAFGKPVSLLKLAGGIEAAHIPIVASLTLYLNWKKLPETLRPSKVAFGATTLAAFFFILFAGFYIFQLLG